jgi:hypothetical protein
MTATKVTMVKIEICCDCLFVLANGAETTEQSEAAEGMARVWGAQPLYLGDSEGRFSWQSCDGCGSKLGGDRFDAYYDDAEIPAGE